MRISVDGMLGGSAEARIPVLDHGFLYGDSVYEVVRTYGRRPFRLLEHLRRLEQSASRLELRLPPRAQIVEELYRTGAEQAGAELYLRIIVSRGVGATSELDPVDFGEHPSLIVIASALPAAASGVSGGGIDVAVVSTLRNAPGAIDPAIKTGNYLNSVLAMMEAKRRGAVEGLLLNGRGELTEGTRSNVFLVRGGRVLTPEPACGILLGVTRAEVLELCRGEGIAAQETVLGRGDLLAADEVFLSSTTKGILPVARIDGLPVGSGSPGATTRRLCAAFEALVAQLARLPPGPLDHAIPEPATWV
jgi:branched-chain amino acid aminotransferase